MRRGIVKDKKIEHPQLSDIVFDLKNSPKQEIVMENNLELNPHRSKKFPVTLTSLEKVFTYPFYFNLFVFICSLLSFIQFLTL